MNQTTSSEETATDMMKVRVDRATLETKLKISDLSVTSDLGSIVSSVLFVLDEEGLSLKSSDKSILTYLEFPDEAILNQEGSGTFTMESDRILQWLKNVTGETVLLTCDPETRHVEASCGGANGHFRSFNPDHFPDFMGQYEESDTLIETSVEQFRDTFEFLKNFTSDSSQFPVAECRDHEWIGMDASLLAIYQSEVYDQDLKIGIDHLKKARKFLKKVVSDQSVVVRESADIYFLETAESGSVFGYTKPVKTLPNLEDIPTDLIESEVWTVRKKRLQQAIGAVSASADADDHVMTVSLAGEGEDAELTCKMMDVQGRYPAMSSVACDREESEQASVEFQVNYEILDESLKGFDGDTVRMAYDPSMGHLKLPESNDEGSTKKLCFISLL